jgi:general L-amino acid transport system permease protein
VAEKGTGSGSGPAFTGARAMSNVVDLLYDRRARAVVLQALLVALLILLAYEIVANTAANLKRQNIASGFGFLGRTAGFDISQTLIEYRNTSTYARAFVVGLTNTFLVAGLGIVMATALGFAIGIARLSPNWLVSRLALAYVEAVRNVPLLLQLLVWYVAVLRALPRPHSAVALGGTSYLDIRGLHMPAPVLQSGIEWVALALGAGVAGAVWIHVWAARRQRLTGQPFPSLLAGVGVVAGLPAVAFLVSGCPMRLEAPVLGRFNYEGGLTLEPEFMALLLGLVTYTAAFIAEIVRSGIVGVQRGQTEAALALGLTRGQVLRLVVLPQAMRIIIPPLTNQHLNLTKNSSLAVAIGYPDLVSVFGGTVLNQTGQAVEVILITMGVYLAISLATAGLMNWFNRRMAIVER